MDVILNKAIDQLPFELHYPFGQYRYLGPGTKLEERLAKNQRGVNPLDEAAKFHDIAYSLYKDSDNRDIADEILGKKALERITAKDVSVGEKFAALITAGAMKTKRKLNRRKKRQLPLPPLPGAGLKKRSKKGGYLIPLASAAITGAATLAKTAYDMRNAKKLLQEKERHNRVIEDIIRSKGISLKGSGLKRKKKRKCSKRTIKFI